MKVKVLYFFTMKDDIKKNCWVNIGRNLYSLLILPNQETSNFANTFHPTGNVVERKCFDQPQMSSDEFINDVNKYLTQSTRFNINRQKNAVFKHRVFTHTRIHT